MKKFKFLKPATILLSVCLPYAGVKAQNLPFSVPDTVCIGDSVRIVNNSRQAHSYYWNFCSGNLGYEPQGRNIGNPGAKLSGPAFIDIRKSASDYYAFITNHLEGTLIRSQFGESMFNTPTSSNLGNFNGALPAHLEGIQVLQESDGQWFVFVCGGIGAESRMVRLSMGQTLDNDHPVVTNFGMTGNLSYPVDLFFYREGNTWYGFTVNFTTSSITRFAFEQGLSGSCSAVNLGNPSGALNAPRGIFAYKENNEWLMFISDYANNSLTRLSFGNSLANTPSATPIDGTGNLRYPFDLAILHDCENHFGFVLNHLNDELVGLQFGASLLDAPLMENYGNIGGLNSPHGISNVFREGDSLYVLVANANSTLSLIFYPACSDATITSSVQRDPPVYTYRSEGNYNVSLVLDEGLPTQENFCKNILAFKNPIVELGADTSIQMGASLNLGVDSLYPVINWSTNEKSQSIVVTEAGTYQVYVRDRHGCAAQDERTIGMDYGIPNFFTPNNDGYNDTWDLPMLVLYPDALIKIYDRYGKLLHIHNGSEEQVWDGTYGGAPVKDETYWYIFSLGKGKKPIRGNVSVIH
jgi:gliding motility-associated-like protein